MEIVSEILSESQLNDQVIELANLLKANRRENLLVAFGFGCEKDIDDLWKDENVKAEDLEFYIHKSIQEGIYRIGKADFHITDIDKSFQILFCHESDIHLISKDENLLNVVKTIWEKSGFEIRP